MSETLPPRSGDAGRDDAGRHAQRDDPALPTTGSRELEPPIDSPWTPPGAIVAPPEAAALALASPTSMPATAPDPVAEVAPPAAEPALAGVGAPPGLGDATVQIAPMAAEGTVQIAPIPAEGAVQIAPIAAEGTVQIAPVTEGPPAPLTAPPPLVQQRTTQEVTCPQCGTVVRIDPRARSSLDFCPNPICDYPLFWVRSAIVVTEDYDLGESHRRMPGTGGRAAAAYLPCPHCSEPNPLSAMTCVRCGGDMHPVAPPPPPPVIVEPAPEPVFTMVEEEDEPINWWLIILGGIAITLFVAFLVVIALSYLI